jgi:hypothetical protein
MTLTTTTQSSTTVPPLVTVLKPFQVTRKQLHELFNSPQLVKRLISAGWIVPVRAGKPGRETLFDYQSAENAYERLRAGEEPPALPTTANHQPLEAK